MYLKQWRNHYEKPYSSPFANSKGLQLSSFTISVEGDGFNTFLNKKNNFLPVFLQVQVLQ